MKIRTLVIAIAIALLGVVVAMAVSILHDGLSARATPNRFEIMLARNARHLAIPWNARLAQNPLLASPEDLRDARLHFADHCAVCHPTTAAGRPCLARPLPQATGPALAGNAKSYRRRTVLDRREWRALHGMPAFSNGGEHGGMQSSWKLVHFIATFPSNHAERSRWSAIISKARRTGRRAAGK